MKANQFTYKQLEKQRWLTEKKELVGGTSTHPEGFGSPIGKLEGINLAIEDMSPKD
jgi:hypothetical protein